MYDMQEDQPSLIREMQNLLDDLNTGIKQHKNAGKTKTDFNSYSYLSHG